ncbi:hypothetical protein DER53_14215 [Parageobacillus toebii NBRC 107807]|uniref:Uncharacterized protein n=1 Tax=Parageobacillus toebii NBRC 107807 TaxID=1223503 RepID=A0A6G9J6H0_9BACL|nr:hypothetical protein [Parageobacillus toebii]MBB3869472.1 hypothetical protein [Parageobacillus toebii NBRC 107807]QIQ33762.1 hypothetical protein DER53_14215 [Parageobacillus toebii NBRC 107807]
MPSAGYDRTRTKAAIYGQLVGRNGGDDFQCSGGIQYAGSGASVFTGSGRKAKAGRPALFFQGRDGNGLYDVSIK